MLKQSPRLQYWESKAQVNLPSEVRGEASGAGQLRWLWDPPFEAAHSGAGHPRRQCCTCLTASWCARKRKCIALVCRLQVEGWLPHVSCQEEVLSRMTCMRKSGFLHQLGHMRTSWDTGLSCFSTPSAFESLVSIIVSEFVK
jgi:hypothetical protein